MIDTSRVLYEIRLSAADCEVQVADSNLGRGRHLISIESLTKRQPNSEKHELRSSGLKGEFDESTSQTKITGVKLLSW